MHTSHSFISNIFSTSRLNFITYRYFEHRFLYTGYFIFERYLYCCPQHIYWFVIACFIAVTHHTQTLFYAPLVLSPICFTPNLFYSPLVLYPTCYTATCLRPTFLHSTCFTPQLFYNHLVLRPLVLSTTCFTLKLFYTQLVLRPTRFKPHLFYVTLVLCTTSFNLILLSACFIPNLLYGHLLTSNLFYTPLVLRPNSFITILFCAHLF